jgi:DNA-directed RNA polymerase specialized sigma24 family protein
LSHDEIAKQLGITSATSRTQLRKATQKLNDMLKKFKQ